MARDKVLRATRFNYNLALQDGSPLARQINKDVLEVLREMAADIEALRAGAVQILEGEIELQCGRYAGTTVFDLPRALEPEQLEGPVLMQQAPSELISDVELSGLVWFAARVKDATALDVAWYSHAPAPQKVKVNCIIGTLEQ